MQTIRRLYKQKMLKKQHLFVYMERNCTLIRLSNRGFRGFLGRYLGRYIVYREKQIAVAN
jgi:hypothetical protein